MSREVRRVPLDFDAPVGETWAPLLMPPELRPLPCPECASDGGSGVGLAPYARGLYAQWWGHAPFTPESNGSVPHGPDHPAVRAFAERNVEQAPGFYGRGEIAVRREAGRLARLWDAQWGHHLSQADVDLLLAEGELRDLTRRWDPEKRQSVPIDPPPALTADEVNSWSLTGFGLSSTAAYVLIRARCAARGEPVTCATCEGEGTAWRTPEHKATYEAWEPAEVPTGEGWQLWQTVSEGGPVTPVFPTAAELVNHLVAVGELGVSGPRGEPYRRRAAEIVVAGEQPPGSFWQTGGELYDSARDADRFPLP